jgi:hypothetical protein
MVMVLNFEVMLRQTLNHCVVFLWNVGRCLSYFTAQHYRIVIFNLLPWEPEIAPSYDGDDDDDDTHED